jgi:LmbE family N-acetylglucosaminyl deacetylase
MYKSVSTSKSYKGGIVLSSVTETVLGIVAHPDDEIGMVGTLKNHADRGDTVVLAWMTSGENTTMLRGTPQEKAEIRKEQAAQVSDILGVKTEFLKFKDSEVPYTVEAAKTVARTIRAVKPDIVITWNDYWEFGAGHPDHRNTCYVVRDAITYARFPDALPGHREFVSLYMYYNSQSVFPVVYVDVSQQKGIFEKVVNVYSKVYGGWSVTEWKYTTMRFYGGKAGCELAEVFNAVQRRQTASRYLG